MKKIIYVLSIALLVASCKNDAPKDYVTLSGKITDKNSDSLMITSQAYHKKIKVNSDGTFSDTLKIETGTYTLIVGSKATAIYLKNEYDLKLSLDMKDPNKTITYTGVGAEVNNYLTEKQILDIEIILNSAILDLEKEAFDKKIKEIDDSYKSLLDKVNNVDSIFVSNQNLILEIEKKYLLRKYEDTQYVKTFLARGKSSPKFVDYENFNGKKTSLDDLKGKYVYVGIWTARNSFLYLPEAPHLKLLEKEFQGKNIVFVSISIDTQNDYNTWKQVIVDEKLGGIQLYAKEDNSFKDAYKVRGARRFILIDPKGNIISADAPKPSSTKLKELLDTLKL